MKKAGFILPITLWLLFAAGMASAQSWTNRFNGLGTGFGNAAGLALDGSGDVFVTGYATGPSNNPDYATIAYSSSGTALWTNFYDGPGDSRDGATAIVFGNTNCLYVTGYATDTNGLTDITTLAYSISGTPLWTNSYAGPYGTNYGSGIGNNTGIGIALGTNGDIFVMGDGASTNINGTLITLCYSSSGVPQWTNSYPNTGQFVGDNRAIAVDSSNNVDVVASDLTLAYSAHGVPLWTNLFVSEGDSVSIAASGGRAYVTGEVSNNYATIAYSTVGSSLWTNWYADTANGQAQAVAVTAANAGNIYVTGNGTTNASYFPDYVTIAYSTNGQPLWTNQYSGYGAYNTPTAMAIDAAGTVYVTGESGNDNEVFGYATIAYTSSGFPLWTNRYDFLSYGDSEPAGIVVDSTGNVYVTGSSFGTNGNYGYATIKYYPPLVIVTAGPNFGVTGRNFGFDVYGPAGSSAIVEASADLQTWSHLQTNTFVNGFFHFAEPMQAQASGRYYRVVRLGNGE